MISWTPENIQTLLSVTNDEELLASFPGANLETLKRRQREFRTAPAWITDSDGQVEFVNSSLKDKIFDGESPRSVAMSPESSPTAVSAGSIEHYGDTGTIQTGTLDAPVTDWSDIFTIWNLDPAVFEVIEPVRMSAWQVGADGEMKYAYKARFRKKALADNTSEIRVNLGKWDEVFKSRKTPTFVPARETKDNVAYAVWPTDGQFGKPGTDDTLKNMHRGMNGHYDKIVQLLEAGYPINEICIGWMGDEIENTANFYASQTYDVELNLSQQIELDFDSSIWMIDKFVQLGIPLRAIRVPSNHGELGRNGSNRSITSPYDNAGTMVGRMLKKFFDSKLGDSITWHIADQEQDVVFDLAGVGIYGSHGHMQKGSGKTSEFRMKNAMEKQILGRTQELANVSLFVNAHFHHWSTVEDRGRTFFSLPSYETALGSSYFKEAYGVWSEPGIAGFLIGQNLRGKYSDVSIF